MLLTETFIDDMDGTLRQIGIGDYVVAKHVGNMVGALGGRHSAFAAARREARGLAHAVRRNIFHDAPPSDEVLALVAGRLERFSEALDAVPVRGSAGGQAAMTRGRIQPTGSYRHARH